MIVGGAPKQRTADGQQGLIVTGSSASKLPQAAAPRAGPLRPGKCNRVLAAKSCRNKNWLPALDCEGKFEAESPMRACQTWAAAPGCSAQTHVARPAASTPRKNYNSKHGGHLKLIAPTEGLLGCSLPLKKNSGLMETH